MSWTRQAIAMLLVGLPLHAAGVAVLAPADGSHSCTDHMCRCAHPPKPADASADASSCHEHADAPPELLFEHAGCRHGQPAAAPVSVAPHLVPAAVTVEIPFPAVEGAPAPDGVLAAGFLEIDLPPPRARA